MTLIESEQSRETRLTQIVRGPFIFRFASYRKSEDAKLNLRSEDYIVSELTSEKALFALCDGVSSSFYGGIGSQFLGETILNWLGQVSFPDHLIPGNNESANHWLDTLTLNLKTELNNKIKLATDIIQKKELTSEEELVRLAEITQRDDFGTQSNFISGILWPESTQLPNGCVLFFWLGNARIRIFNNDKDLTHLLGWGNNPDQLKEVWSSKEGVVGSIYSYLTDFSKITTIIAYSDGLENVEEQIQPNINEAQLETLVNQSQLIKDDDVTYLELSTIKGQVAGPSEDMVDLVRDQVQLALLPPESKSDELTEKPDLLHIKDNAQVLENEKLRRNFILIIAVLPLLCFSMGLLLGSVFNLPVVPTATSTPSVTVSPSETIIPSFTASPSETATPSFTSSPSQTITPSFTASPSQTPFITPSLTFTMTSTTTATFTATLTPTP